MRCYHCAMYGGQPGLLRGYRMREAVGVCRQCGEAVCEQHAVKSDIPLPGDPYADVERAHPALLPLLCADCYAELRALATAGATTT